MIDFRTHSAASDGALAPAALVDRALRKGVKRLAITDHDTIAGYLRVCHDLPAGIDVISGVELSCEWGRLGIHVLGLGFDPEAPGFRAHLMRLDAARRERAERIDQKLERAGMPGAMAGALEEAAGAQIGRPHFARWMVAAGHVASEEEAFKRFLGRGKAGDISVLWPSLLETVEAILDAQGMPVLAHPAHYGLTATRLRVLVDAFTSAGGAAIEIINGRPKPGEQELLWRLANERSLRVSVGSDFHRDSTYGAGLGVDVTNLPSGCGIWEVV